MQDKEEWINPFSAVMVDSRSSNRPTLHQGWFWLHIKQCFHTFLCLLSKLACGVFLPRFLRTRLIFFFCWFAPRLSFLWLFFFFLNRTSATLTYQSACYYGKSPHVERSFGIRAHYYLGEKYGPSWGKKKPQTLPEVSGRCCGASPKDAAQSCSCDKGSSAISCTTRTWTSPWAPAEL